MTTWLKKLFSWPQSTPKVQPAPQQKLKKLRIPVANLTFAELKLLGSEGKRPYVLQKLWKLHGPVFLLKFKGIPLAYVVSDGEWIYRLELDEPRGKIQGAALSGLLGKFAIIALDKGELHRALTRRVSKALHANVFRAFIPLLMEEARTTAQRWSQQGTFEVHPETTALAKRYIFMTVFRNTSISEADQNAFVSLLNIFMRHFLLYAIVPGFLQFLIPGNAQFRAAKKQVFNILHRIIRERRAQKTLGDDILGILLSELAEEKLSDEAIVDNFLTLFLAGFSTMADMIAWIINFLGTEKEAAQIVREEVRRVFSSGSTGHELLKQLERTLQFVNETLRLRSSSWQAFARIGKKGGYPLVATDREGNPIGEYLLKRRRYVLLVTWFAHNDPTRWANPDEFRMDREYPRTVFHPFGKGEHTCSAWEVAPWMLTITTAFLMYYANITAPYRYDPYFETALQAPNDMIATFAPEGSN